MRKNYLMLSLIVSLLIITAVFLSTKQNITFKGKSLFPGQVTQTFYKDYLKQKENPLKSGYYKSSKYLTDTLKKDIEQKLSSSQDASYDLILCSKDRPNEINVNDPVYEGSKASVQVEESFPNSGSSLMVGLIKNEKGWLINEISCSGSSSLGKTTPSLSGGDGKKVTLYFRNDKYNPSGECNAVFPVERTLPAGTEDTLDSKLSLLVKGVTPEEKEKGFTSVFSSSTSGILNLVSEKNKIAYVDLTDIRSSMPELPNSCNSQEFFAEVVETLKHDGNIDTAIFAINEDPRTFYDFVKIPCTGGLCDPTPFKPQGNTSSKQTL